MRADGSRSRRITAGRFDWRPAWSPDGQWIAYQSTAGIRIVRPDGAGMRRIATPDESASYPMWTPDGRIVYASHAEERYDWPKRCERPASRCGWVWTSRLDGTRRRALVRGRDAHWSPDGPAVVFTPPDGGVAGNAVRVGPAHTRPTRGSGIQAATPRFSVVPKREKSGFKRRSPTKSEPNRWRSTTGRRTTIARTVQRFDDRFAERFEPPEISRSSPSSSTERLDTDQACRGATPGRFETRGPHGRDRRAAAQP